MMQASNPLIYWMYIYLFSESLAEIQVASIPTQQSFSVG